MERLSPDVYCQRAALELVALMRHQQRPRAPVRHASTLLRRCVEEVLAMVERTSAALVSALQRELNRS